MEQSEPRSQSILKAIKDVEGMKGVRFAKAIGSSPQWIHMILRGKKSISVTMARSLKENLGWPIEFTLYGNPDLLSEDQKESLQRVGYPL